LVTLLAADEEAPALAVLEELLEEATELCADALEEEALFPVLLPVEISVLSEPLPPPPHAHRQRLMAMVMANSRCLGMMQNPKKRGMSAAEKRRRVRNKALDMLKIIT